MLSEAKPALKPDIREAKGNPNRGGGDARRAIPTAVKCRSRSLWPASCIVERKSSLKTKNTSQKLPLSV